MSIPDGTANIKPAKVPWGTARQMTDFEAMIWRSEMDPRLRSDAVIMDILDRAPEWDRLVAAHEWGSRMAPRLRHRVVEDIFHLRPPAWVPTDLDLGYHLSRVRLAGGEAELMDLVSSLHMAPFDRARPLWRGMLVEGLPDGRAAYLLKVHHAMTDGHGAMQLFNLLHSDRAEPTPDKEMPALETPDDVGTLALTARRGTELGRDVLTAGWRVAGTLRTGTAKVVSHPRTAQSVLDYAQSLGRLTAPPGPPSPLLRRRGLERRMRALEMPLRALQAGGRAAGGTLNDAYLAGLLGGLRHYHAHHGIEVGDLPIGFPVSLRRPEHALGGNQFGGACIAGPSSEPDPARRVRLVREMVLRVRDEPALNFMGAMAPLTSRLPAPVLAAMTRRFTSSLDLQASNVPGLNRPAYIAGARIQRMYGFGPVPGGAIMATLVSHEGTCCIAVSMDSAAVPDPDVLASCFEHGLQEIVALGGTADA